MDIENTRRKLQQGMSIYDIPLRVTFYARVSTDKDVQIHSLNNQISTFSSEIKNVKAWTYVEGYIDEGLGGGSTKRRDNFNCMIDDARCGLFDLIITKEISRFARNTLDSIKYTRELLSIGVPVIFQSDGINTLDADSELRLTIMAAVAQDEIRKLSERLKFGFKRSIKDGRVLGNSLMYGYHKKDGKLTINEKQAEIVRTIFHLYVSKKMGVRKIAQYITDNLGARSYNQNQFNNKTVQNIILNPKYKGFYCAGKTKSIDYLERNTVNLDESEWVIYRDENIPAIVSEELWDEANRIYKEKSEKYKNSGVRYHNKYSYSGKIKCAKHGTSFHRIAFKTIGGETETWICKERKQRGASCCDTPVLRTVEINKILKDIFLQHIGSGEDVVNYIVRLVEKSEDVKDYSSDISSLESQIDSMAAKKDKLLDLAVSGAISNTEFKKRNDQINIEILKLEERINFLHVEESKVKDTQKSLELVKRTLEGELNFENGVDPDVVSTILDSIVVYETPDNRHMKMDINLNLKMGNILGYEVARTSLLCGTSLKNITPPLRIRMI